MQQHPAIRMSTVKESNYFAYEDEYVHENWPRLDFPVRSWEAYLELFSGAGGETLTGEASPIYLESPQAPHRIREVLPDARLIVSIRDPVRRAYSGYLMHARNGAARGDLTDFSFDARYVRGGFYSTGIQRYFEVFAREQIKVVLFEDLKRDTQSTVNEIYEFIGAPPFVPDTTRKLNVGTVPNRRWLNSLLVSDVVRRRISRYTPGSIRRLGKLILDANRSKPPVMPEWLEHELVNVYTEEIDRLEALLDMDLDVWRERGQNGA